MSNYVHNTVCARICSSGLVELIKGAHTSTRALTMQRLATRQTYARTYHVEDLGLLDLFQNSSTSVGAELSRVTNAKGEGSKVLYLDGTAAVQLSHALILQQ